MNPIDIFFKHGIILDKGERIVTSHGSATTTRASGLAMSRIDHCYLCHQPICAFNTEKVIPRVSIAVITDPSHPQGGFANIMHWQCYAEDFDKSTQSI
jgi:hypothetical protein